MQISEVDTASKTGQEREGFEFQIIPVEDPKVFPNFKTKATQDKFFQWGIQETIRLAKYRFNKSFHLIGAEDFLKDLFNDS